MYCPTEHINNKSHFLGVICYCQSAVFLKRIVPITPKNDKVAKIADKRLTKIWWPFLRSPKLPKGCQLTPSLGGEQCLYLEGAIDFNNRAATALGVKVAEIHAGTFCYLSNAILEYV